MSEVHSVEKSVQNSIIKSKSKSFETSPDTKKRKKIRRLPRPPSEDPEVQKLLVFHEAPPSLPMDCTQLEQSSKMVEPSFVAAQTAKKPAPISAAAAAKRRESNKICGLVCCLLLIIPALIAGIYFLTVLQDYLLEEQGRLINKLARKNNNTETPFFFTLQDTNTTFTNGTMRSNETNVPL